jgi:hypothetical protein
MGSRTIWWKIGDHEAVQKRNTTTTTHDLCGECGAAMGIHGHIGHTLVHPGDAIIVHAGKVRVERPDPLGTALAATKGKGGAK